MARTLPKPAAVPRPAQLIEREEETELVLGALDGPAARGGVVVFEGPAGIGKSRLLAELSRSAQALGACTLRARGGELEVGFALGVARELFEPRLAAAEPSERDELLAAAGPAARPLTGADTDSPSNGNVDATLHGAWRLVRRLVARGPLLIAVDDLQWVDRQSLELLVYIAQRLEDLPVLIACTRTSGQPGPHASLADRLESGPLARTRVLAPLSRAGVEALAAEEGFREPAPGFLDALMEAAGGVPFLTRALLAAARAEGFEGREAAERVAALGSEPVGRATALRLERLPECARALASAAAVLGPEATPARAAAVAGLDRCAALEAADTLRRAELLDASHTALRYRHGLVRQSVLHGLAPGVRAQTHLQAARVLAADGCDAERTAEHLLAAQRLGEPWAFQALRDAGRSALAAGRRESGVLFLRRALEEDPDGPERAELLAELGEAEAAGGDPAGAARLALVAGADPGEARAQTLERLGATLWLLGRDAAAAEAFERGLRQTETDGDDPQAARLRAGLHLAGRLNPTLHEQTLERVSPALREPGFGRPREPAILASIAFERALAGRRGTRVAELAERALEAGDLGEPDALPGPDCYAACCALIWADSLSAAEIALTMALEAARRRGHAAATATAFRFRAWAVLQRGRLDHAAADALEASEGDGSEPCTAVPGATTMLAEIDMEQGRLDEAGLLLDDPSHRTGWDDGPAHAFHLGARGRLRHLRGDHAGALEDLLEAGRRLETLGVHNPAVLAWRSRAAVAAAAAGDRLRARTLAAEELALAKAFGAGRALGVAQRAAALVGEPGGRLDGLREAVATLDRSPGALDRARARIDLGAELRRAGRRRESRDCLRGGLDLAQRCEAWALASRGHEELMVSGARPRRERVSGSEALTPRERQVAQLAARGVRNREIAQRLFITPKTVEWHLGNAYRKLELHSRGSLVGALGGANQGEQTA
jgi:DNA-binding CsgD family transcriptional regulator